MKLTRKQRVVSFIVFIPLFPFAVLLSFMNHFTYFLYRILEKFSMSCERIDRAISKKYELYIKTIK